MTPLPVATTKQISTQVVSLGPSDQKRRRGKHQAFASCGAGVRWQDVAPDNLALVHRQLDRKQIAHAVFDYHRHTH